MPETYLLGIDLGTTTCRAAIVDLNGHELATARLEVTLSYPRSSWAEIDPELWWQGVQQVVREVIAHSGLAAGQIAGVGLSGLMHAPVLLDAEGAPVTPAMLWMDQRCARQCDAMRRELAETGSRATQPMATGVTAPKLRWLAEERPEALAQARYLLLPKDFIRFRLTGIAGTDVSDAGGTGMFDREKAISTLDGDHCACPACHGDLTDSSLSARGWRHCKVCRCAWKVEMVGGQRYAMHIAGRVHSVPAPQPVRRTAAVDFDSEA